MKLIIDDANIENIDILEDSGVNGICVVRAIMDSPNVEEDTRKLKEKINKIL